MNESPEPQEQPGETQPDEGIVPEQEDEEGTPSEDIEDPGTGGEAPTG
jgi:hypothetical protein